jgi:integrative and conjugative element protein (TIGR02256 family)
MSSIALTNPFDAKGFILIEPNIIETINAYRQDRQDKLEAGGILLGYIRGYHIHVADLTEPQRGDGRERFRFSRRDPYHQDYAVAMWEKSSGYMTYIGEWHTHPEIYPTSSGLDTHEWLKITRNEKNPMIFIIGSCEINNLSFYCAKGKKVIRCNRLTYIGNGGAEYPKP